MILKGRFAAAAAAYGPVSENWQRSRTFAHRVAISLRHRRSRQSGNRAVKSAGCLQCHRRSARALPAGDEATPRDDRCLNPLETGW